MAPQAATAALPRPTARTAVVSFILVFLCGALLGAVVMHFAGHPHVAAASTSDAAAAPAASGLSMSVADWKKQLDLTDDQTEKLTSVLDDFSRYYDNVLADGNSRIMQILNPEQRRRFEQMIHDRKP